MNSCVTNRNFFRFTDHLGNVRVVASADGRVLETNDYYPYGMLMGNSSSDYQPFKYSGKELDRMNGLNLYDHGARMSDPALGRWHSVDPLAEKYYDVSPYAMCGNNPVMMVDLDGREVRGGVGPADSTNVNLKNLEKELAAHDDPNSIMIVAHGVYENEDDVSASYVDIKTYNPKTKKWKSNNIRNGKDFFDFLCANSKPWKRYQKGEISADDLHIVFYSCGSAEVVKNISSYKAFKDVTFIAPTQLVLVSKDLQVKIGTKGDPYNGKWNTYVNGKMPFFNATYSGAKNLRPGTRSFNYNYTCF